jgi:hypothetical protein
MNQEFQLDVVLTSDSKDLVVFMVISFLPFEDSVLGNIPLGSSHFDPIAAVTGVVDLFFPKSINESRTVSSGRESHKGIDECFLILF